MNILDMLTGAAGGGADTVSTIASNLGLDPSQAKAVMENVVPALGAGLKNNATSADGLKSLAGAITSGNHMQYLKDPARMASAAGITDGNAILGHILGGKEVSRNLASAAAEKTGVDPSAIKQMLPMLATAVMGAMSQQNQADGGSGQAGIAGLLGSFLDTGKGGSMANDLLGMAGKLFGGNK